MENEKVNGKKVKIKINTTVFDNEEKIECEGSLFKKNGQAFISFTRKEEDKISKGLIKIKNDSLYWKETGGHTVEGLFEQGRITDYIIMAEQNRLRFNIETKRLTSELEKEEHVNVEMEYGLMQDGQKLGDARMVIVTCDS